MQPNWSPCQESPGKLPKFHRPKCSRVTPSRSSFTNDERGISLDLGPLNRRLLLRTDAIPEPSISVRVKGTVRGVVDVGEGKEKDRINLGTFRADRGKDSTVMVSAREPDVQLRVKSASPDYLP